MLALAKLATPQYLRLFAPFAYVIGILLLVVVDVTGHIGKGAQRWLDVGFMRFQPSEIMKLAVPMMCAWYMHERPLPPTLQGSGGHGHHDRHSHGDDRHAAGPWHGAADRRLRAHRHAARRTADSDHPDIDPAARRRRVGGLAFHPRLPAPAHPDLPESGDRSARRRLSHHPIADRHRLGRRVRQGLHERQPGAAGIPAGTLHRLHLRRHRRGVRPARPAA